MVKFDSCACTLKLHIQFAGVSKHPMLKQCFLMFCTMAELETDCVSPTDQDLSGVVLIIVLLFMRHFVPAGELHPLFEAC